jgi:hypothetical protein
MNPNHFFLFIIFVLNISFVSLVFFPFILVFKFPKDEVYISIPFIFYFQEISPNFHLKKNLVNYTCSYPCNFLNFGLCFSNLHINVYHVFDAHFD